VPLWDRVHPHQEPDEQDAVAAAADGPWLEVHLVAGEVYTAFSFLWGTPASRSSSRASSWGCTGIARLGASLLTQAVPSGFDEPAAAVAAATLGGL
jgi:hypothetical protein